MQRIQFDPRLSEFRADPYLAYDMLRDAAPIFFWEEWGLWFLTRYEDCNRLLRDNRLGHYESQGRTSWENPLSEIQENWMLFKKSALRGLTALPVLW